MSLGAYKHSRKRTKAASSRHEGSALVPKWPTNHRGLTVNVRIKRALNTLAKELR